MKLFSPLIQTIHFVGIGGIGMSGLAEVLHTLGYKVQGSDAQKNANSERLKAKGMSITIGHSAEAVTGAHVVVISSAISPDNPEVRAAREQRIPIIRRADMLAELMRFKRAIAIAGSHGKTTTTSLIAALLDAAGEDPTVINGGIVNAYGTNARLGSSEWMVAETDESDGSFTRLFPTLGVITNIDPEHMEFYGTVEALHQAFHTFLEKVPFYGACIVCVDHPTVRSFVPEWAKKHRIITYGLREQADVQAFHVRSHDQGMLFDIHLKGKEAYQDMFLPMVGEYNVQNALAMVAVAQEFGFSEDIVRQALKGFQGVKRRFTYLGQAGGLTFIDDYAHHPEEIRAVLKAARQRVGGRLTVVCQPHRVSRLAYLFEEFTECFDECDRLILVPLYTAGESPREGVNSAALAAALKRKKNFEIHEIGTLDQLKDFLYQTKVPEEWVVCLGAGSITQWAQELYDFFAEEEAQKKRAAL